MSQGRNVNYQTVDKMEMSRSRAKTSPLRAICDSTAVPAVKDKDGGSVAKVTFPGPSWSLVTGKMRFMPAQTPSLKNAGRYEMLYAV
jgi:hypothetical protein